jgi:hypothetical protein
MNVSLDHSHRYMRIHTTSSSISVPSALPVISLRQTAVQDKEQSASRRERSHRVQNFHKTRKRYSCSICNLDYAQPQGLTRHQLERHNARLCLYCRDFTWGRLYLFKKHLVMRHPGIDHNAAINEATRAYRRRKYLPPPQASIPTAENDSWGSATCAESLAPRPSQLTLFPSAVAKLTPVFPLDMSSITYNPQPSPQKQQLRRRESMKILAHSSRQMLIVITPHLLLRKSVHNQRQTWTCLVESCKFGWSCACLWPRHL